MWKRSMLLCASGGFAALLALSLPARSAAPAPCPMPQGSLGCGEFRENVGTFELTPVHVVTGYTGPGSVDRAVELAFAQVGQQLYRAARSNGIPLPQCGADDCTSQGGSGCASVFQICNTDALSMSAEVITSNGVPVGVQVTIVATSTLVMDSGCSPCWFPPDGPGTLDPDC